MGAGHGGPVLRQGVEGQPGVYRGDGAHHVQVHQPLQLLTVGGGAEHEDLLILKTGLAQLFRHVFGLQPQLIRAVLHQLSEGDTLQAQGAQDGIPLLVVAPQVRLSTCSRFMQSSTPLRSPAEAAAFLSRSTWVSSSRSMGFST